MLVLKGDFIRENQPDRDNKPLVYGKSLRLRRDHARNPGIRIRHWGALVSLRAFLWQNAFDRRKPISPSRNSGSGFFLLRQRSYPIHLASLEHPASLERNALFVHWTGHLKARPARRRLNRAHLLAIHGRNPGLLSLTLWKALHGNKHLR